VLQPEPTILLDIEERFDPLTETTAMIGDGVDPRGIQMQIGDPDPERGLCGRDFATEEDL